jgi:hypothetical protein
MNCVLSLITSTEKNKVTDKVGSEEKWTKRIGGDNIIIDRWGKTDGERQ